MNRYQLLFKSSLVIALVLTLAVLLTGSAAAETDSYMGIAFHPFTLDGSNNTCVDFFDADIGQTKNCDPVNLVFPGRTWQQVSDMLMDKGWDTCCEGSHQSLHYDDGAGLYMENEQLVYPATYGDRYHIRLWQAPGDTLVTFAAVHHEELVFLSHVIDMSWEDAEIDTANTLCGLDCEQTGELAMQLQIQGSDEEWRSWWNNGSATVIPAPSTINEPPIASFTFDCDGLACAFDASASTDPDGTIIDYVWDFGDDSSDSGVTPNHTYAAAGTYSVSLTVSDNDGATGATNQSVIVTDNNYLPLVIFSISCTGLSCSFDASASTDPDGTIVDYAWDFGDFTSDSGVTSNHTYPASGTYLVTLAATDNDGGIGSDSQNVTVVDAPAPAVHVGDLDGTSIVKKNWQAEVTITVHSNNEALVANATVSGAWSGNTTGTAVCITGSDGRCTVISDEMPKKSTDHAIFSVTGVQYGQVDNYDELANHDLQGDSSGTVIQVNIDGTTLDPGQLPGEVISLSAVGYKVKGIQYVDLTWSGINSNTNVEIYRDGENITTLSSGAISYTDNLEVKRGGPYIYQVCEAGTAVCSEPVNVSF